MEITKTKNRNSMDELLKRLAAAGFPRAFVRQSILPVWWNDSLAETETEFLHGALLIARAIGADIKTLLTPEAPIMLTPMQRMRFKTPGNAVPEAMRATTAIALRAASLAVRATAEPFLTPFPNSATAIRARILEQAQTVTLESLLAWCRNSGIPIFPMRRYPGSKPHALCVREAGRPVIVLCHRETLCAWQAFHLAHEIGHVALGHLEDGESVTIDLADASESMNEIEKQANDFAVELLLGKATAKFAVRSEHSAESLCQAVLPYAHDNRLDPQAVILNVFHHDVQRRARNKKAARLIQGTISAGEILRRHARQSLDWSRLTDENAEFLERLMEDGAVS